MRFGRDACHYCHRREEDPRRLIEIAYSFTTRHSTARALSTHITHVDCFLDAGGTIAGLADSQLWHVPTKTWQRLGYLPSDSRAEYARVQDEERMALKLSRTASVPLAQAHEASETLAVRKTMSIPASRGPHSCRVPRSPPPSRADRGARSATTQLRRAA